MLLRMRFVVFFVVATAAFSLHAQVPGDEVAESVEDLPAQIEESFEPSQLRAMIETLHAQRPELSEWLQDVSELVQQTEENREALRQRFVEGHPDVQMNEQRLRQLGVRLRAEFATTPGIE